MMTETLPQMDKQTPIDDRQLLQQFSAQKDERAFETLVQRHAGLVFGVCQRVLQNQHDAEDAFQAVFLVLAKKAGNRGWTPSVAPWLYQTAYRVALKARTRRQRHEKQASDTQLGFSAEKEESSTESGDLRYVLDRELQRIPEHYRKAVLLCYLEGKSQDQAAHELGWSVGALRGRLFRGREMLRQRLAQYRSSITVVGLGALLNELAASASASESLVIHSSQAAKTFALGQSIDGLVSNSTIDLTRRTLNSMMYAKLKPLFFLVLGLVAITLGGIYYPAQAESTPPAAKVEPPAAPSPFPEKFVDPIGISGVVQKIDLSKTPAIVTIRVDGNEKVLLALDVAKDAKVFVGGKATELKDLKKNAQVTLVLADDHRTVKTIDGVQKRLEVEFVKLDGDKLTMKYENDDDKFVEEVVTLGKDIPVYVDDFLADVKDLADCRKITIEYAVDDKTVARVHAKWFGMGDMEGDIKTIDVAKGEITLTIKGEDGNYDITVKTNPQSKIYVNGKPAAVKDLQAKWEVQLRVEGADKLIGLRAEKSDPKPDDDK